MPYVESYIPSAGGSTGRRRRPPAATGQGVAAPAYVPPPAPIPSTVPVSQNTERPVGVTTRGDTTTDSIESILAGDSGGTVVDRFNRASGRNDETLTVGVPEIVPRRFRRAVAKHGQRLNEPLQEAGVDMTGPEYLARLIQFESGWNKNAENPSSAFGFGQFIDSTAQDFRQRLGVETQDPSRPSQMIKGASMHASGDFGYNPLYAGYNPGYSSTDPILGVEGGNNVPVQVSRRAARRAADGGGVATGSATAKQPGVYAGSRRIVKELLGPFAQTQDWADKEDRGDPGGTLHDIGTEMGFAADVDPSEKIVDRISRKLGLDPKEVDYGTTGLESGLTYKGYDIEFLPYTHGSGPHVHLGAEWTGGSPPSGTVSGAPSTGLVGGGGGVTPAPSSGMGAFAAGLTTDTFGQSNDPRKSLAVMPIQNPLSARAALPQALAPGSSSEPTLQSLLGPDPNATEDDLVSVLERFRPKRRLG